MHEGSTDLQLAYSFSPYELLVECLLSFQTSLIGGEELGGMYLHDLLSSNVEGGLIRLSVGDETRVLVLRSEGEVKICS